MINYSKSLFLSLSIHILLFGGLFLFYTYSLPKKMVLQEKQLCIKLQSIKKETSKVVHKKVCKAIQKKKKRVHKKKNHKIIQKKVFIKAQKRVKKKQEIKKKKIVHVSEIKKKRERKPLIQELQKEKSSLISQTKPFVTHVGKKEPITHKCKSVNKDKVYIQNNLNKIALLIKENLYYPRRARKRGIEGSVMVKFFLHKDGTVSHIQILSSKSDILSRAAMKTINNLSGKFPKPSEELTLSVPINYELR